MKIPNAIRIGGLEYAIDTSDSKLVFNDRLAYGSVDNDKCEICLNPAVQDHQIMCVTLWHEILHALIFNAGLKIDNEEKVVERLSRGVYQVLQDNGCKLFDIVPKSTEAKEETINGDCSHES